MASGYNIAQVDVPGILGLYQNTQDRRVQQMLLQRKIAAEDRDLARTESMSNIYKNLVIPGQAGDQSKGGDPSSGGMSGAYAAPSTPVAPSAPLAAQPGAVAPIASAPWAPAPDDPSPPSAAPAAAAPATAKPPVSLTAEDHGWVSSNAGAIHQLLGIDPPQAFALLAHLKSMDDDQRAALVDGQNALHTLAASVQKLPYGERRAAIAESAPELMRAHPGVTPQMVQEFDPTDQNIQKVIGQALGIKGMADQAEKARAADETHRHNVADEANSANNGYLNAGLAPPGMNIDGLGGSATPAGGDTFGRMLTAESGGKQFGADGKPVTSSKGAVGIAQVMPGTGPMAAKAAGLPWDPVKFQNDSQYNQTIGRAYYQSLVEHYGGDESKAVAAYNAGPGRVDAAVAKKGTGWVSGLPQETRDYLAKVNPQGAASAAPSTPLRVLPGGKLDHSADSTLLDDAGITYAAQIYAKTGQIPPLGQGKDAAKLRAQIVGRAAQLDAAGGVTGSDRAGQMADYKADRAALTSLSRTASQVFASEKTAQLNAQQVLQTSVKGAAKTGVPIFNSWVQAGRNKGNGDPDVAEFNLAVGTFATEYAKVISGATGGAVTSDSARHEVMGWINNAQTPEQLHRVIARATAEMQNRRAGLEEQQKALRDRLGSSAANPTVAATPRISNAADYAELPSGAHYIDPQGQPRVKR